MARSVRVRDLHASPLHLPVHHRPSLSPRRPSVRTVRRLVWHLCAVVLWRHLQRVLLRNCRHSHVPEQRQQTAGAAPADLEHQVPGAGGRVQVYAVPEVVGRAQFGLQRGVCADFRAATVGGGASVQVDGDQLSEGPGGEVWA